MRGTTTDRIREALGSVDYPADKWALVEEATRAGAEEEKIRALRVIQQDRVRESQRGGALGLHRP